MDSDYTHQTSIYGEGINSAYAYSGPSWSPDNGSIAFMQNSGTATAPANSIKAVDVTVNTDGTVSGTNARTIFNLPSTEADNAFGHAVAWSNTSTMDKIAFATRELNDSRRTVWIVPATGGTPIKVWECDSSFVKENGSVAGHAMPLSTPTWSPDDSRIAFERLDSGTATSYSSSGTSRTVTIMIFTTTDNGSTWSYTDSIKHSSTGANSFYPDIEWSRTGLNKLALWYQEDGKLYYANPSSTSSITTDGATGGWLSWSPNNSAILHALSSNIWKSIPFTTTTYATGTNPSLGGSLVRWKH